MQPLIGALEQEGFAHFIKPCNTDFPLPSRCPFYPRYPDGQKKGTNPDNCLCGTPWSQEIAQITMGGLGTNSTVKYEIFDGIHDVSDINPIHLPHVWKTCTSESSCTLNITTVTQQVYDTLDPLDTGFSYISASN
eukprot:UN22818